MNSLWQAEPTLILAVVSSLTTLVLAFGVPVTKEQMGGIMAFVTAVLALVNRQQVTSPATLQAMTPKSLAAAQDTAQPVKDVVRKLPVVLLTVALSSWACTSARHVAVVADATFAQAVFAVDDAEFKACELHALSVETCAAANPKIKQALLDVKAVTAAIQASPKTGVVPRDLPSLLTSLTDVQGMLAPLAPSLVRDDILTKIQYAIRLAIAVLNSFVGVR